jgi:hypothetical protein
VSRVAEGRGVDRAGAGAGGCTRVGTAEGRASSPRRWGGGPVEITRFRLAGARPAPQPAASLKCQGGGGGGGEAIVRGRLGGRPEGSRRAAGPAFNPPPAPQVGEAASAALRLGLTARVSELAGTRKRPPGPPASRLPARGGRPAGRPCARWRTQRSAVRRWRLGARVSASSASASMPRCRSRAAATSTLP